MVWRSTYSAKLLDLGLERLRLLVANREIFPEGIRVRKLILNATERNRARSREKARNQGK